MKRQEGFTLIETVIATLILVTGLVALAGLFAVSVTANSAANVSTATTAQATQQLEAIKAQLFDDLIDSLAGNKTAGDLSTDASSDNGVPFFSYTDVPGVGKIVTRWQIAKMDNATLYIRVRAEAVAVPMMVRTRAEFATFRACAAVTNKCPYP